MTQRHPPLVLAMLTVCCWLAIPPAQAQQFTIKRLELSQGKLNVYYDLIDTVSRRLYTVNVYSSQDNFITPLQKVSGDLGLNVKPGMEHRITWDAPAELGANYIGKVSLEIRGRLFVPFIAMNGFDDYKVFKRNRVYNIAWTGGRSNNVMNFDLYQDEEKVMTFPNVANVGSYELIFPSSVKPGTYRFKISDTKNTDETIFTEPFRVKRKVPLLLKAIPVVGLGAALGLLGGSKSSAPAEIKLPPDPPAK